MLLVKVFAPNGVDGTVEVKSPVSGLAYVCEPGERIAPNSTVRKWLVRLHDPDGRLGPEKVFYGTFNEVVTVAKRRLRDTIAKRVTSAELRRLREAHPRGTE